MELRSHMFRGMVKMNKFSCLHCPVSGWETNWRISVSYQLFGRGGDSICRKYWKQRICKFSYHFDCYCSYICICDAEESLGSTASISSLIYWTSICCVLLHVNHCSRSRTHGEQRGWWGNQKHVGWSSVAGVLRVHLKGCCVEWRMWEKWCFASSRPT